MRPKLCRRGCVTIFHKRPLTFFGIICNLFSHFYKFFTSLNSLKVELNMAFKYCRKKERLRLSQNKPPLGADWLMKS